VKIKLSRHAKRRARLYRIPKTTLFGILENAELSEGKHEIVKAVEGFKFPLKIVVNVESDIITVITNYPMKKERRQ